MKKQKSLLIVLYYYFPYVSGVSVNSKRLAESLVKRGYRVTVLTSQHEDTLPRQETINGVLVIREPVTCKLDKGVIMPLFWLKTILLARKYNFVNLQLPMAEVGLTSLFIPKQKNYVTYNCDINLGSKVIQKVITKLSLLSMKVALYRCSKVAPSTQDYFENSSMKRFSKKSFPIYPAINESDFQPTDFKTIHNKLKIGNSKHKIGFVGRIVYEKGIKYLLESIEYLAPIYPDLKVIVAGDYEKVAGGSIKDSLNSYITKYPDNIIFTGYLTDRELKEFYSMIDILVLPSIDPLEAFGMVQVEAMLCETPVLSTNRPGQREIINKSGYGLLFKPRDPKSLSNAVQKYFKKPSLYAPTRKKVIELFGSEKSVNKYIELFEGGNNE